MRYNLQNESLFSAWTTYHSCLSSLLDPGNVNAKAAALSLTNGVLIKVFVFLSALIETCIVQRCCSDSINLCKSTQKFRIHTTNLRFFLRLLFPNICWPWMLSSLLFEHMATLVNLHQFFRAEGGNAIASMHPCRTQQHVCLNSSPRFAGHEEMSYPMMTGFRIWRT